jgi:serine/threonine protein kinase
MPAKEVYPDSLFAPPANGAAPASADVPTFPASAQDAAGLPEPGQRLGDFELLAELGRGAFARVFLARQVSLNRAVALKVSPNQGSEAHALARLEHDSIVRVYDEAVDWERNLRLLWMQHVPGATLEHVLGQLAERDRGAWAGRDILKAVAAASPQPAALDLAALRDLQRLQDSDFAEAVCWLGARLAEALAHAHGRGVLHRDVKPANILVNHYGRPLLADFNIAAHPHAVESQGADRVGGTLLYMAPEHLDAFAGAAPPEVVDARSDVYSLGVVLFELLTGQLPFEDGGPDLPLREALPLLAAERRAHVPSPRQVCPEVPPVLDRVVRRCLESDPERRYPAAAELARALDGCLELCRAEKQLPPEGPLSRAVLRHPAALGVGLSLLPHLVGLAVVLGYNALWLAGHADGPRLLLPFLGLVFFPMAVAFGLAGWYVWGRGRPVWAAVRHLQEGGAMAGAEAAAVRRRGLCTPLCAMAMSAAGWLPPGILVPWLLSEFVQPLRWEVCLQLGLPFAVAGLIALTYNLLACQFLMLRVAYPRLWVDAQDWRRTAREELRGVGRELRLTQLLPVLIPLAAGAASMAGLVAASPGQVGTPTYLAFQLLVLVLIVLGIVGCWLAMRISRGLVQTLTAFTGSDPSLSG